MKNQITYTEHNTLYYPDLAYPEQTSYPLGKYATLLTEGRLNEYLHEIDLQAHEIFDTIVPRLAQERGIDEALKARNLLQWAAEMNNIKASAEEIILQAVVYQ